MTKKEQLAYKEMIQAIATSLACAGKTHVCPLCRSLLEEALKKAQALKVDGVSTGRFQYLARRGEIIPDCTALVGDREPTADEIRRGLELEQFAQECLARNYDTENFKNEGG